MVTDSVSIIIPLFNESRRLPSTLARLSEYQRTNDRIREVILVDDGSRDGTAVVAEHWRSRIDGMRLIRYSTNAGKGYAVRRGVLEASGDRVLLSDADLSTPIEELAQLEAELGAFDVVIGSRALDRSRIRIRQPWYRQEMGRMFNRIMRRLTGLPFHDSQCGFKLLRRDAARRIFEQAVVDRFAYDVEMLMLACRMGYRVQEVPVVWLNSPDSRVRILRDSARMLWDVVRLRWRIGRVTCLEPDHSRT